MAALSHGATDFVAKPYKAQIILHRAASIISLRETAAMINQFQYDRLTGLYSKEYFYQRVRETLRQNPEKEYDIVCSDIDNFKLINDIFGIPGGGPPAARHRGALPHGHRGRGDLRKAQCGPVRLPAGAPDGLQR